MPVDEIRGQRRAGLSHRGPRESTGTLLAMTSNVLSLIAEEAGHDLPMPATSYGLLALVFFALLLAVTWTFRNNHQKHVPPSETHGAEHAVDQGTVDRHH